MGCLVVLGLLDREVTLDRVVVVLEVAVLGLAVDTLEVFGCTGGRVEVGVFGRTVLVVEVEIEAGGDE